MKIRFYSFNNRVTNRDDSNFAFSNMEYKEAVTLQKGYSQNVYLRSVYSQNVYSQNVYSQNVYSPVYTALHTKRILYYTKMYTNIPGFLSLLLLIFRLYHRRQIPNFMNRIVIKYTVRA
jgi:hypothetical protein